ncbi:MAG: hypothetical protein WAS55_10835 [Saprospiraceae bacterium]
MHLHLDLQNENQEWQDLDNWRCRQRQHNGVLSIEFPVPNEVAG